MEGAEFSNRPPHNEAFSHVHAGRDCQEQLTHVSREADLRVPAARESIASALGVFR